MPDSVRPSLPGEPSMVRLPRAVSLSLAPRSSLSVRRSRRARRALVLAGAIALSVSVTACGRTNRPTSGAVSATNPYVWAGPMTYQIQVTRALNPFATGDAQYLTGVPKAQSIPASQIWFGVFLWAKNQSGHLADTTDRFTITDSSGTVYRPWPLNSSTNQWAWTSRQLAPDDTEPGPDTTASFGPTQGGLVLFRLDQAIYSNRPLTLNIFAPGQAKPSTISLDL